MLPVILYKELHATPFQLAAMIALRPLVSLLSIYWSAAINKRPDRLTSNIIIARILAFLPFFFFPFVQNCWFLIASFAIFMMLAVGIVPAWMELLKLNIPEKSRERLFSYTQAFGYMGGGLIPFIWGWLLDGYSGAWCWLFPATAFLGLTAIFFQKGIIVPLEQNNYGNENSFSKKKSPVEKLLVPWKNAWQLVRDNLSFRYFQIGSMVIGSGLMIIQPSLPIFLVDNLRLSYTEIALALTLSKGIGFGLASPFWAHLISRINLFHLSALVSLVGCLFPFCLLIAQSHLDWLYIGYLFYGFMQCGNELIWNMSGPLFAKKEDSSVYTSVNVVAIGLRGCLIPALGSVICSYLGAGNVLIISSLIFFLAVTVMMSYDQKMKEDDRNTEAQRPLRRIN